MSNTIADDSLYSMSNGDVSMGDPAPTTEKYGVSWDDLKADDSIDDGVHIDDGSLSTALNSGSTLNADSFLGLGVLSGGSLITDDGFDDRWTTANRPSGPVIAKRPRDEPADPSLGLGELSGCSLFTNDGFGDQGPAKKPRDVSYGFAAESYGVPLRDESEIRLAGNFGSLSASSTIMPPVMPPVMIPVMMVPMQPCILPNVLAHSQVPADSTPEAAPTDTKTLEKRKNEIQMIQRDFPDDVVAHTPMGRAGNPGITKRPWEEAKAQYRQALKVWNLKSLTHYSESDIEKALELVHRERIHAKDHVLETKDILPRLERLVKTLTSRGYACEQAMIQIKNTYSRDLKEEEHLEAALNALRK